MERTYPDAITGEMVYHDYDDDYAVWAVFGEDSGHCYAQFYDMKAAEDFAVEKNEITLFHVKRLGM